MTKGITLIICTYNGAKLLKPTINHIIDQEVASDISWEVLFINNASTDNTKEIIENNWSSQIPMRIIDEKKKGLINARIRGLLEATYDIVSFIDDDNWIDKNWIQEVYNTFYNNPQIAICGSKNNAHYETQPPKWFQPIASSFAIGSQGDEPFEDITNKKAHVWGAGLTLRKDIYFFLVDKGFSFFLTGRKGKKLKAGEDTEMCYAFVIAGYQIWYNENMKLTHFIPAQRFRWKTIIKMYKGFGESHSTLQIYRHFFYQEQSIFNLIKSNIKSFFYLLLKRLSGEIKNFEGNEKYLEYIFIKTLFISTIFKISFYNNFNAIKKFSKIVKSGK